MHLSKFYGVFFSIMLAVLLPVMIFSYINGNFAVLDQEVAQKMGNASNDAMRAAVVTKGKAFDSEAKRTEVLNAFYSSLAASFGTLNRNIGTAGIAAYIPCVVLADNDGLYTCYGKEYLYWNSEQGAYCVSPFSAYAADYSGGYSAAFHMDGTADIRKDGSLLAYGNYEAVKGLLSDADINALPFMADKAVFHEESKAVIANCIARAIEQDINQNIEGRNNRPGKARYQVLFYPKETDFNAPTLITAFTGNEVRFGRTKAVSCILSGAAIGTSEKYYVTKNGDLVLYHRENCSLLTEEDKGHYYTQKEAAMLGATGCQECIQ